MKASDISAQSEPSAASPAATHSTRSMIDTLSDSVLLLLVLTVVQRLIGFVRSMLFCRWLNPEELGQWDLAFGFLTLAAPVAVLGLPGSFGRYVEYFERRKHLRTYLKRTATVFTITTCVAVVGLLVFAPGVSELVFGRAEVVALAKTIAWSLAAVIAFNTLSALYSALRMYRVVSGVQFVNAVLFAVFGVILLQYWRDDALSVVVAFALSCGIAALGTLPWLRQAWREIPPEPEPISHQAMWSKLVPFAAWIWLTNWLTNFFVLADRYIIVHYAGFSESEALEVVGQYHAARVIPLLLVGVGEMFSAMITPHLSNDWEVGHRERVSERLNLALKLFAIGSMAASLGVIFCSPIIFDWMLQGKYNAGLSVLPLTFVYSTWASLAIIAHNYLWCAERARIAPASMAVALVVNVSLNLALLPRLGLLGAVISTGTAYGVWLLLIVSAAWRAGMQVHRGTVLLMIAPVALALSPWAAAAVLLAICFASLRGNLILDEAERSQLLATLRQYTARLERMLGRTPGSGE